MIRPLLILFFPLFLNGQNPTIDSLIQILKSNSVDTVKIKAMNQLGEQLYAFRPDSALNLFSSAADLCESNLKKGMLKKEEHTYQSLLGQSYGNMAFITEMKGNIPLAIELHSKALALLERLQQYSGVLLTFNNLGLLMANQGEKEKAMELYRKGLALKNKVSDELLFATTYNNISAIFTSSNQLDSGLYYSMKAYSIRKKLNDIHGLAESVTNMSAIYYNNKQFEKAIRLLEESIGYWKQLKDLKGVSFCLRNLSELEFNRKNYSKALQRAKESLTIAEELQYPELIRNSTRMMYRSYKATGDYANSLVYFEKFILMRDSINNVKNRKAAIKSQLKYEYEKQAAADSVAHAKESEIKNAELAKQKAEISAKKNQQYALFGGLGLVMVFAGFMYNRFKITQKQKGIIEEQKEVVEEQKKLVEEKQKEILDSIHYAKRIQMAQIPSEKQVEKNLERLRKI